MQSESVQSSGNLFVSGAGNIPNPMKIFLGGDWRPPVDGRTTLLYSPVTEQPYAEVACAGIADAEIAVAGATEAFDGEWPRWLAERRVETCRRFCSLLEEEAEHLARAWAVEAGMPIRWGRTLHKHAARVAWTVALDSAVQTLTSEVRETAAGRVTIEHEPVGPVLAILPYNGPLPTLGSKVVPALLAGCPVIVKAAPESALTMRIISACAAKAGFPAGVLSIMAADVEVSQHLVRDPRIELISFTGGPAAASHILRQSADNLVRTVFELGGKSPAILLPDLDLDRSIRIIAAGAMSGSGQVCAALSRILIPRARHDEVVDALAERYRAFRLGDPLSAETDLGPLANRASYDRTVFMVADAMRRGARAVTGGRRPKNLDTGWFYEPTLLTDVAPDDEIACREVFGPVTVVLPYDNVDEAIHIANGTQYGLAASVFTQDEERALRIARKVRSGSVAINAIGPTMAAPFGGVKRSGWGRECGPEGIREFTASKQILLG